MQSRRANVLSEIFQLFLKDSTKSLGGLLDSDLQEKWMSMAARNALSFPHTSCLQEPDLVTQIYASAQVTLKCCA